MRSIAPLTKISVSLRLFENEGRSGRQLVAAKEGKSSASRLGGAAPSPLKPRSGTQGLVGTPRHAGPLRRGRVDVTASGYCGDPDQRRRRPARCPPVRARAVPRCVRAVARTEISVLLGARFPLCLASLDRLSQLSTAAREQVRAWSPPRVLSARGEKATLEHLQVAVPMARTLSLASSLLTTTAASCLRPDLARSPRRQLSFGRLRPIIHLALIRRRLSSTKRRARFFLAAFT